MNNDLIAARSLVDTLNDFFLSHVLKHASADLVACFLDFVDFI